MGRGQREQFLPREVLAIRAKSDRMVEEREAHKQEQVAGPEKEAQQHEPESHQAGEHKQEPQQGQKHQPDLEQDDELELE